MYLLIGLVSILIWNCDSFFFGSGIVITVTSLKIDVNETP